MQEKNPSFSFSKIPLKGQVYLVSKHSNQFEEGKTTIIVSISISFQTNDDRQLLLVTFLYL